MAVTITKSNIARRHFPIVDRPFYVELRLGLEESTKSKRKNEEKQLGI